MKKMEKMENKLTKAQAELLQELVQNEMVNILDDIVEGEGSDLKERFFELKRISVILEKI